MSDTVISVKNVSKDFHLPSEKFSSLKSRAVHPFKKVHYKTQHALKDINLDIKEGEFFGIVGRNGSGKSTLLKMLAGIYQPTKGSIEVKGKLVPFIELGVGFNPELTGRENVFLNGALLGFSEKEVAVMYDDIVEFAELGEFMEQKLKNYSSGMQVRLAFSMAIRAKADILLIDEVLAVGDADFQRKCFEYFRQLKAQKKTVVFISHDMNTVREYCDRAAFIDRSYLIGTGTADDIASDYTKLFVHEATGAELSDSKRWGESVGIIQQVNSPVKITESEKKLKLEIKIHSKEKLINPIVGFVIKNSTGQSITGSNTKLARQKPKSFRANEQFSTIWEIDNIFSDGVYTVDAAILKDDGITALDWWESCARFSAFQDTPSIYPVSPATEYKMIEGSKK